MRRERRQRQAPLVWTLRRGVEDALVALGEGFLSHPENTALRAALQSGALTTRVYFQSLLRLVYRSLFLRTAEERGLSRRGAATATLGGPFGLFAEKNPLDVAKIEERHWLAAISLLARSCSRDVAPEELFGVHESLLALVPRITEEGRCFSFATGGETKGNARKLTGSYYTPDSLVQVLLDSALDPVIAAAIAASPEDPAEALLNISIVDPACGSGFFLLAAARRLALRVARIRAKGAPSPPELRRAARQVVERCIYGVDLDPIAVELCKASLWLLSAEPGSRLSIVNEHIRQGNALLGATPELLERGIPDEAWEPIEGDDKKVASALKRKNKEGAGAPRLRGASKGLDAAFLADLWCAAFVWPKQPGELAACAPTNEAWRRIRDGEAPPLRAVKTTEELRERYGFFHWHLAFPEVFARGGFDVVLGNPPWERVKVESQEFFASRRDVIARAPDAAARKELIRALPEADPSLFSEWTRAGREAAGFSHFVRRSGRYPLCAKGDINTYALFAEHNRSSLRAGGRAGFVVPSGIITESTTREFFECLMSSGSIASFWEFENEGFFSSAGQGHMVRFGLLTLCGPGERVPSADFFFRGGAVGELLDEDRHFSLTREDVELLNPNSSTCPIFRTRRDAERTLAIYRRMPVLLRDGLASGEEANPWDIALWSMFHMTADAPLFRTALELRRDGWSRDGNRWRREGKAYVPLYEAKMVSLYTHRHGDYADAKSGERIHRLPEVAASRLASASYEVTPHWWVPEEAVLERRGDRPSRGWSLVWRDVTDARASARSVIAAVLPGYGVANSLSIMTPKNALFAAALLACLSSFVLDYVARQKIAGLHLNFLQMKQLPLPPARVFLERSPWGPESLLDWLLPRVLELTYTAWDLKSFARDVGYDGPPFRWDASRRSLLRAEIDAALFHVYGLSREDVGDVLETFPIVRRSEEKAHGEYRAKRVVLGVYDELAEAIRTGKMYSTRLDPPPADVRVAHT